MVCLPSIRKRSLHAILLFAFSETTFWKKFYLFAGKKGGFLWAYKLLATECFPLIEGQVQPLPLMPGG